MAESIEKTAETNQWTQKIQTVKRTSSINRTAQLVRSTTVNEITEKDPLAVDFIQIKNYDTQDRASTCIRSGPADPNTDVFLSEHLSEPFNSARALSMMRQNRDVATGPLTPSLPTVPTVSVDSRVQKRSTDARRRKGGVVRVRTPGDGECDKRKTQSESFAREDEIKTNNKMYTEANETTSNGIAKVFSTSRHYSQLIKKGQPNVYLLNAKETSIGEDFRCFDIGQPEGTPSSFGMQNHKVIILMGATGCGKSTLINGMVNYILGVKWDDLFRFKCVRETTTRNQVHSQTNSVTAYTLRHHDGMAVPYSITIIDTPGYGHITENKRDRETTRKIQEFLTQQETRVDEIHAVCFVAPSGNGQLTASQRHVIDSVLSVFSKDVKENIRLLVTFADNAHPPVVEACLAANFPVTSASAGITFSKFNCSVLYASNRQHEEDGPCFDELFWDMSQEHFHKFFTMLEGMNGKDLKSTRNVIQSRRLLEQSLKDIEQELEVCFAKIENMEIFQRKMREYGHKMETDTNFSFEKTEMRLTEMFCEKGFFAYNCRRCSDTCEKPNKLKYSERQQKRKCEFCTCPASEHEYQQFEWRLTPVKITTTPKDMKAEYESNYDRKVFVEQLLADNLDELNVAKAKVFSLLEQMGINVRSLESTALPSNALTPSDYLSLMRSRVAEEQAPGYLTRLETLTELQNCLAADASASALYKTTHSIPDQTHRLSKTDGATQKVNYGFTTSQHVNNADDYRMATINTAGASSNYSSGYHTRTATGPSLNQNHPVYNLMERTNPEKGGADFFGENNQSVMTRQVTAKCDSLQTLKTHGLHRGDKLNQWNSTIPQENCWKENVSDKQGEGDKHEVQTSAIKAANKFSAVYDVQLQLVEQSLKVAEKELATTQQEISDKIEIKSNADAITGSADTGQDFIVHEIEKMKVHDIAEGRPSSTASTAADCIHKSSAAAGEKQIKQRSDSNDRETHAEQSDPKLNRFESGLQLNSERHVGNQFDSSREETDGTTKDGETRCKINTDKDDTKQEKSYDDGRSGMKHKESPSNRRIAEIFLDTSEQFCTLIKKGRPNVYLLNAEETSTSEDFRWFDIGRSHIFALPSKSNRNHKVIIFMGATGCGKSTLINGMVNYILGVKWNDPFRFKCVRDDETTAKYQAHSQTSTVTAYTLRHHDGMAVPYSITIIDTPGYGDTRGVQRDKEITRKIHQFLTQPETRVDEIHAACFVAASGNSRLTPTQSYIIDSVLSIFGKDVKENIRLLVTFADNAHPPVVEACLLAANFPVPITFSKFNSSVLYANNEHQGEDDFCFDELFWDMGQENFHKFFTMLEKMNGKDLKSTRNVIQNRGLLEKSLRDIEQELEVCFVKIENIEIFQRKMRLYGHRMESNKNFIVEKTEMRLIEMLCEKGYFAYNCRRCGKTCEKPNKLKYSERLQKRKCEFCTCPDSEHEYQTFEWRLTPVKITTTLKDMKAEYESNYGRKVTAEQLLADNLDELNMAKAKVFSLLEQVGISARKLDSTALRSNALSPSDYLSLMRSRVAEEQAPGYLTRLETLTELQNCLAADASASASHKTARSFPNQQTHRTSNTGGASHRGNYGSKTCQHSQHGTVDDFRITSTNSAAGASNYSSGYYTRVASGPSHPSIIINRL
ncbi:uncharacterized protein LOC124209326 isoform X2 [Daphnia pulex]|uniref:uncharacterized protein LOC124209326 isoform X2 n=1 Tax=Daphnia pulex TaxID=6669 RepID=UPI001EDF8344|nr:uncharacterized protein LOC124209326 isoform X2 [Daphnia pulex]